MFMLPGGDATPSENSQSPRHPEGWSPPDMHDFGSAFDSLNLSTVPSNVRIEHLPQEGQHGQHIEEMLRHAVQENGFADMPASLAGHAGRLRCYSDPTNPPPCHTCKIDLAAPREISIPGSGRTGSTRSSLNF